MRTQMRFDAFRRDYLVTCQSYAPWTCIEDPDLYNSGVVTYTAAGERQQCHAPDTAPVVPYDETLLALDDDWELPAVAEQTFSAPRNVLEYTDSGYIL